MTLHPHNDSTAMWIDETPLSISEAVNLIRKQGALPRLIQDWVLDKTLAQTPIEEETQQTLLNDYRSSNGLISDEAYADHLQKRHINEPLLYFSREMFL